MGYLVFGAKVLSVYEPEMDFFKAFYFNFVTLTTIGLGDFVPRSFDYLYVTLCYIGVGLALTTMAIELAADLLRKLHYVGRKIDSMANTVVWFGGKKMTMKKLIKNLGDQFNIPEEQLANFDLDEFVDNAIKVEAGEIKTLRKPNLTAYNDQGALSYRKMRDSKCSDLRYVDERLDSYYGIGGESARTMGTLPSSASRNFFTSQLLLAHVPHKHHLLLISSKSMDYLKTLHTVHRLLAAY
ncbi:Ion channel [Trichostrongylus colubriformis]|uniref:Ion channel n=1 Tax=Trichostrongylus colubriformis TaxID=6319 RepID=A0AAN8IGF7_TRICO